MGAKCMVDTLLKCEWTRGSVALARSWSQVGDSLNVRGSRSHEFQLGRLLERFKQVSRDLVIDLSRTREFERISDHDFEAALSKVQSALGFWRINSKAVCTLHDAMLLNDFVLI